MSTPTTTVAPPRIIRFTASREQQCGSPWLCDGVKAGARCAYVGGDARATAFCGPCADRAEGGEPLDANLEPAAAASAPADNPSEQPSVDEAPPAAELSGPAAGDDEPAENMPADIPSPAGDEPLCDCPHRGDGFTDAGAGRWVHAACGRPAAYPVQGGGGAPGRVAAARVRTVDVVTPGTLTGDAVGDVGRLEKLEPAPAVSPLLAGPAARLAALAESADKAVELMRAGATAEEAAATVAGEVEQPVEAAPAPTAFRILVTGSRNLGNAEVGRDPVADRALVRRELSQAIVDLTATVDLHEGVTSNVTVVHGAAAGADEIADEIAKELGCRIERHPADWRTGKAAGVLRNGHMVNLGADVCVAFPIAYPIGSSRGTQDCMARAKAADIPVRVVDTSPAVVEVEQPAAAPAESAPVADEHPVDPRFADTPEARAARQAEGAALDELQAAGLITVYQNAARIPPPIRRADDEADGIVAEPAPAEPAELPPAWVAALAMPLPNLAGYMADAAKWGAPPQQTGDDVVDAIRRGILAGDIRGRQVELGPSEVGHECSRWLAYRLAGVAPTGTEPVPWRQRIGTLVHNDTDDHLHRDNLEREGAGLGPRWLTGTRVDVGELYPGRSITGTLDILDILTGTIIDLKVPGSTAMRSYGPGKPEREQYRKQVQLYGRGVMRAGYLPAFVAVLRLSPARELTEGVLKFEPFDAGVAETALARAGGIARMVDQLGPRAAELVPPTSATCHRCPWFRPDSTELTTGCPGAPGADLGRRRASVDDLVA